MDIASRRLIDILKASGYTVSTAEMVEYGCVDLYKNGDHMSFKADTFEKAAIAAFEFHQSQRSTSTVVDL